MKTTLSFTLALTGMVAYAGGYPFGESTSNSSRSNAIGLGSGTAAASSHSSTSPRQVNQQANSQTSTTTVNSARNYAERYQAPGGAIVTPESEVPWTAHNGFWLSGPGFGLGFSWAHTDALAAGVEIYKLGHMTANPSMTYTGQDLIMREMDGLLMKGRGDSETGQFGY